MAFLHLPNTQLLLIKIKGLSVSMYMRKKKCFAFHFNLSMIWKLNILAYTKPLF